MKVPLAGGSSPSKGDDDVRHTRRPLYVTNSVSASTGEEEPHDSPRKSQIHRFQAAPGREEAGADSYFLALRAVNCWTCLDAPRVSWMTADGLRTPWLSA